MSLSRPSEGSPRRTVLHTQRLVLVPQTVEAARALLAGDDPGFPLGTGYPHADSLDALRLSFESDRTGAAGGWFVLLRENRAAIGECGTKGWVDEHGRVEIGYGLAPPYWGRGYGTEAVGALVEWLCNIEDVHVVTAEVEVGNVASRRVLERLGFTLAAQEGAAYWFELPTAGHYRKPPPQDCQNE